MKTEIRAGQYYAAKYHGDNGDLIIGLVRSVRHTGEVILTNLLTGKRSTKSTEILSKRNHKVSKVQADKLLQVFKITENKAKVRGLAVLMAGRAAAPVQAPAQAPVKQYELKWPVVVPKTATAATIAKIEALVQQFLLDLQKLQV